MAFKAVIDESTVNKNVKIKMRISAQCVYKLFVNGKFVSFGPARMAHGFWCVDEIDLTDKFNSPQNVVSVVVGGYYCYSYSYLRQESFLCAEIVDENDFVYAATGVKNFDGYYYEEKAVKVQHYSFQRPFSEVYRYKNDEDILVSVSTASIQSCTKYRNERKRP